jgi:magnesium-protoporphyrin O-methyltransferase
MDSSQTFSMNSSTGKSSRYEHRRSQIETYFDRTAAEAWARLTSTAPVGRIRATVRAGRERMGQTLLNWLPDDLSGRRILDAGCGTGAFAIEAARRGAQVLAIDLSPTLVDLARERMPSEFRSQIEWRSGDMLDAALGSFDHVVAMDSLIHYQADDAVRVLSAMADRTSKSIAFTFAPSSAALQVMHGLGLLFPSANRAPSIVPIAPKNLRQRLAIAPALSQWKVNGTERISSGFYTSQAMELTRQ